MSSSMRGRGSLLTKGEALFKNTVPLIEKYVLHLISFERGLMENWSRK
jgi:hypothetical protein